MDHLGLDDFTRSIHCISNAIQENKGYLTKLDSFIGDGDHGSTIARGFTKVVEKIRKDKPESISELLKDTGFTLITSMGGASGPLFGTFFTEMSKEAEGKDAIGLRDFYAMISNALAKISRLGGAKPGDKTMVDSLGPAVKSLGVSLDRGQGIERALKNMSMASKRGAASTKDMIAKKGRSRYHGKRSIGYQDAGATTIYLIINAIYKSISQKGKNEKINK